MKCCVIGHTPDKFPWDYSNKESIEYQELVEQLACYVDYIIRKKDYINFLCGVKDGIDFEFAETIESLKQIYPHITLEKSDTTRKEMIASCDLVLFFINGANDVTFADEMIFAKTLKKEIEIFRLDRM